MRCDWEQRMVEATHSGSWTSSLRAHLQDCPQCAQTELIASLLQEAAAVRSLALPPAGMVWRRAQAVQRERKLQRAVRRPFLIAGALGFIYCLVLLLWGMSQLPVSVYRWFTLSAGPSGSVIFAGASLSAIMAAVGSYMFLTENNP
jgi:hypothetical protein